MTERFTDRGLLLQQTESVAIMTEERGVSVLSISAVASGKESGVLRADTNVFVRVKIHGKFFPLGVLRVEDDMNVVLAPKSSNLPVLELSNDAVAVSFIPNSVTRQDAVKVLDGEGGYDMAVIDANHFPVRQEDARLAHTFMSGREELLEEHDIDPTQVMGVEITVGVI